MKKFAENPARSRPGFTRMAQTALLFALICVLAVTPLGYLPVGPIRATTIHIPVIIGAVLLGPKIGAFLGGVFGLTSLLINTFTPTPLSFVFSPLVPVPGQDRGSFLSLLIVFVPRILIGVVAAVVFLLFDKLFGRWGWSRITGCALAGFLGSMTNTLLVMGGIYVFFGKSYAAVKEIPFAEFFDFIISVICINGVIEAIVAALLASAVCLPLFRVLKRSRT